MHALEPAHLLAEIVIPDAWQCFRVIAPLVAAVGLWCLIRNIDLIINRLFPHWEWESKLGWLNFRANQQAEKVLRWIGYFVYAVLAASLYGIVWGAEAVSWLHQIDDPKVMAEVAFRLPVLLVCVGVWLVYLGLALIPRLRAEHEEHDLEKFRKETEEAERELHPPPRFPSDLTKTGPDRRQPGG